jgi:hypothetical protein
MKISKKSILIFVSGFAFAVLVGIAVFIFLCLDHVKKYGLMFAPEVHTDQKVRESFRDGRHRNGLPDIPPTANKLLYIQSGGIDPTYYTGFSASKENCEKFIKDFLREHTTLEKKTFSIPLTKDSGFPSTSFSLKWDEFTPHL